MRHTPTALLAVPFALAACAAPPAGAPTSVEYAVLHEVLTDYYADFSARDWEAFADDFWPGATITTVWQPPGEPAPRVVASTVPEFVAKAPEGPGSASVFEERMTALDLRVHGNLALAWAEYDATFGEPGELARWSGVDAITLLEHEGAWRITSIAFAADE